MRESDTYQLLQTSLLKLLDNKELTDNEYFYHSANLDDMHSFYMENVKE